MPKAARAHTTKPATAPQRDLPLTVTGDPVVTIGREIQRLWDAHHGAEVEKLEARQKGDPTRAAILDEHCAQITEWLNALELVGTFTIASSLPGAMIQMAWALNDLHSLAGDVEAIECDSEAKHEVSGYVDRVRRLVKSAADVVLTTLGDDYEPVRKIVETYAHLGDRGLNWLLNVDNWADQAGIERTQRKQEAS